MRGSVRIHPSSAERRVFDEQVAAERTRDLETRHLRRDGYIVLMAVTLLAYALGYVRGVHEP
jgi:hypothetical protein